MITLGSNMHKPILLPMSFDNQLMRIMIDMNICRIHHNVIGVAEEFRHLFQRDSFGFGQDECEDEGSEAAGDDEDLIGMLGNFRSG